MVYYEGKNLDGDFNLIELAYMGKIPFWEVRLSPSDLVISGEQASPLTQRYLLTDGP